MKKITTILVEDNSLALEMLTKDISKNHKEIEVIGTATSFLKAWKEFKGASKQVNGLVSKCQFLCVILFILQK